MAPHTFGMGSACSAVEHAPCGFTPRTSQRPTCKKQLPVLAYADGRLLRHKLDTTIRENDGTTFTASERAELGKDGPRHGLLAEGIAARRRAAQPPGPLRSERTAQRWRKRSISGRRRFGETIGGFGGLVEAAIAGAAESSGWAVEPDVGRVAHGVSGGLDGRRRRARLRALGNAVVPQCAQVVGEVIQQMITNGPHHVKGTAT